MSTFSPRRLKVEEAGDFWKKNTFPFIRLKGKWLRKAGIEGNCYVEVTSPQLGVLVVKLLAGGD